jgi:hypothetical protein
MRQQVYFQQRFRRGNAEGDDNQGENTPVGADRREGVARP